MKLVLSQLIDAWFEIDSVQHVFADHFRSNFRCEKLLTSLHFDHQQIPMIEGFITMLRRRCFHRIVRRRLDAPRWRTATGSTVRS